METLKSQESSPLIKDDLKNPCLQSIMGGLNIQKVGRRGGQDLC